MIKKLHKKKCSINYNLNLSITQANYVKEVVLLTESQVLIISLKNDLYSYSFCINYTNHNKDHLFLLFLDYQNLSFSAYMS